VKKSTTRYSSTINNLQNYQDDDMVLIDDDTSSPDNFRKIKKDYGNQKLSDIGAGVFRTSIDSTSVQNSKRQWQRTYKT
jgi:hypothetical protein